MLNEQTMGRLHALKLNGMAEAYEEQRSQSSMADLTFEERLAMLVDRQWLWRENRALARRLAHARLKEPATLEDVDFRSPRGLQRGVIDQLAGGDWLRYHQNAIITGPTGTGKTFLACALAQRACRDGHRTLYFYAPKLFRELALAQADGSVSRLMGKLAKAQLLVVDDWGSGKVEEARYRDFLEILEDRHGRGSTLLTSQLPLATWHEAIPEPTLADAILDRLVHNAHRIELKGESMRKRRAKTG